MTLRTDVRRAPVGLPSWSYSRHRLLGECERAVFWRYYGSRGMGLEPNDPAGRRAFALKWLTTLPLLIGTAVHTAARLLVEAAMRGAARPDFDTLVDGARYTLNHAWRSSQPDLLNRFWRAPAIHPALREVVYRGQLRDAEIEDARWRLRKCLASLCDAPVLDDVAAAAADSGPEGVVPGFAGPEHFDVDGSLTWVALDLAYLHQSPAAHDHLVGGPCWCVADFKTGAGRPEPDDERLQLAVYALWLEARGYPNREGVYLGRIVDLQRAADRWYALGPAELTAARAVVAEDMARQRGLMTDASRGIPQPKAMWALAGNRGACRSCNFLELCREDLALSSARDLGIAGTLPGHCP